MDIIAALELDKASSDTVRAGILEALKVYASEVGKPELHAAAVAAMPAAHPWTPPEEWRRYYLDAFDAAADPDRGIEPGDGRRYSVEYWQNFSDAERQERLSNPLMGRADGYKDCENLNEA